MGLRVYSEITKPRIFGLAFPAAFIKFNRMRQSYFRWICRTPGWVVDHNGDGAAACRFVLWGSRTYLTIPGYIKQLFVSDFYKKVLTFRCWGKFDNIYFKSGDEPETVVSI